VTPDHFSKLRSLVELEREEEKNRLLRAHQDLSLDERAARGFALVDLVLGDEFSIAGRPALSFGKAGGGDLGGNGLRVGDIARVTRRRNRADEEPTGVVARRSWTQVALAFEEPTPEWVADGNVVLETLANDVTYQRLVEGLRRFADAREGRLASLRAILEGQSAPRFRRHPDLSGLSKDLNPAQRDAVTHALAADDVAMVHGPPGTGKTVVLAEIARLAASGGERVLAAAGSNHAVDNLAERLSDRGVRVVRLGHPARVSESLLHLTLDAQLAAHERAQLAKDLIREALELQRGRRGESDLDRAGDWRREAARMFADARRLNREAAADILDRAQVVCATATGLESDSLALQALNREFDLGVFDEATQSTEPATLVALSRCHRMVLGGDHRQLPPTVLSQRADREGLGVSLFERMMQSFGEGASRMLQVQHRMNAEIMAFASQQMYGGLLRAHPRVAHHQLAGLEGVHADPSWRPVEFLDTAGKGFDDESQSGESRRNPGEAELVANEIRALLNAGVHAGQIAVITPYAAQAQLLRSLVGPDGPEVDTVDGFQGREKEAVVVSLTRSNGDGDIGFLADVRRMNVAVTRARRRLLVVGDSATVGRHPFYAAFIEYATAVGRYRTAWELDA
jgi:ATP-dependent RNA/DNA helicase IGHMBP2